MPTPLLETKLYRAGWTVVQVARIGHSGAEAVWSDVVANTSAPPPGT